MLNPYTKKKVNTGTALYASHNRPIIPCSSHGMESSPSSASMMSSSMRPVATTTPVSNVKSEGLEEEEASNNKGTKRPYFEGKPWTDALKKYYGFDAFREGQEDVIQAVLEEKRDAAIFWATGQGKSICFQIPALVSGKTAVVISPLISLMQDQCTKLNALGASCGEGMIANHLSSYQLDSSVEHRAMNGEYKVIYVTPERIVSSSSLLSGLERLHEAHGISLFAVDEGMYIFYKQSTSILFITLFFCFLSTLCVGVWS